ncbi:MAG TPA: hypothetical protein VFA94_01330 [Acidimicrobiales bacterium]|nr:hypothetical protein [Acidimicrobiales bacterium]
MRARAPQYRVVAGGVRVGTGPLAFAAALARAVALAGETARVIDAERNTAAVLVRDGVAVAEYRPDLVLFPTSSGEPLWLARLNSLLAEQGEERKAQ